MRGGQPKSFRERIEQYAAKQGVAPSDLVEVKLICQNPLIDRMESTVLSTLTNCQYLRLSTNKISNMITITGMKKLEILSLSRNQIRLIKGLDEVGATLKQLWLSYNEIPKLDGLNRCEALTTLYMAHNKIHDWSELDKLNDLKNLKTVVFIGNEIYRNKTFDHEPRLEVLRRIPHLTMIDGVLVQPEERTKVEEIEELMAKALEE